MLYIYLLFLAIQVLSNDVVHEISIFIIHPMCIFSLLLDGLLNPLDSRPMQVKAARAFSISLTRWANNLHIDQAARGQLP